MDSLYNISVRLGLETTGFSSGMGMAERLLGSFESKAQSAVQALEKLKLQYNQTMLVPGTPQHSAFIQQLTGVNQGAIAAQANLAKLKTSMALLGGGLALTAVGVGLADGLMHAAKAGAALQVTMAGIGIATGATHAQMAKLSSTFVDIGLKNQMSNGDVANVALAATHAGMTDPKQLQSSIGTLANFAEVQQLSTHVSRDEATKTAVEYAHVFGAYTPQLLNPLVNVLSKALTHTPLSGAGFEALVSQFGGMTSSLYGRSTKSKLAMEQDDTMMGVLLGQMGQGTRGGTQFGSGLIHMAVAKPGTAAWTAKQKLEEAGGGQFFNQDGSFRGDKNLLTILTHAAGQLSRGDLTKFNHDAFGTVGMKLFGNLEQGARLDQWNTNATTFARIPGLDKQQSIYNATAEGQSQQWHKNVETMVTLFGTALLPAVLKVSQALVGITHAVVDFMDKNPGIVKFAAGFALVATGAALVIGPILAAIGAVGMLTLAVDALDLSIAGLDIGLLPLTLIILGIGAAIAAVTLVVMHWGDIMHWAHGHVVLLHNILLGLMIVCPPLALAVGAAVVIFTHWSQITQTLGAAFTTLLAVLEPYWEMMAPLRNEAMQLVGWFGVWVTKTDLLKQSVIELTAPFTALGTAIHSVETHMSDMAKAYGKLPGPLRGAVSGGANALLHSIPIIGGFLPNIGGGGVLPAPVHHAPSHPAHGHGATGGHAGIHVHIEHLHAPGLGPHNAEATGRALGKHLAKELRQGSRHVTTLRPSLHPGGAL